MSQQINLLNPALRRKGEWLSLKLVALVTVAALVIEAGLSVVGSYLAGRELARFKALETDLRMAQDQLAGYAGQLAARRADPALEKRLAEMQARLKGKEEALSLLERGDSGRLQGFSGLMRGLARQTSEGVWLTGFDFSGSGSDMDIRGNVLNESQLPPFVQRLNQEEAFKGRYFAALSMRRIQPKPAAAQAGTPAAANAAEPAMPFVEFSLSGRPVTDGNGARGGAR